MDPIQTQALYMKSLTSAQRKNLIKWMKLQKKALNNEYIVIWMHGDIQELLRQIRHSKKTT